MIKELVGIPEKKAGPNSEVTFKFSRITPHMPNYIGQENRYFSILIYHF